MEVEQVKNTVTRTLIAGLSLALTELLGHDFARTIAESYDLSGKGA
jgi:hypothetical protein